MNPNDISLTYRQKFLKNQLSFNKKYRKLFDKMAADIALLVNDPTIKFSKSFKFSKVINGKITTITATLHDSILTLTENNIRESWKISTEKNDEIVNNYLKTLAEIKGATKATYFLPNTKALEAFILRAKNAETLSSSIWKVANQARGEMEIHLGLGVLNGDSANIISQRIRTYLNNPTALFRRVRDNNGRLIASKAMLENKPGQGVYNSAFKNAMRVARTNANQSFQLADSIRWRQLDMVIGIEIKLSVQHPDYNYPEICELLAGIYPKTYIFIGNHPQCLCIAVPILMPNSDFNTYLKGNEPLKAKQITEYPPNFKKFWGENFDKYSNYKTMPFIMEENLDAIKDVLEIK